MGHLLRKTLCLTNLIRMRIITPTYLIAELSGEVVNFVTERRELHNPDRTAWPVDITIAGSSEIGTIKEGQQLLKQRLELFRNESGNNFIARW